MDRSAIIDSITGGSPNRLRERYFEKHHPDTLRVVLEFTAGMPDLPFKWRVWHWVNDRPGHVLCPCGRRVSPHISLADGYRRFCSAKCAANDPGLRESARATLKERYGVDHYSKTDEYSAKVRATTLDRYGVDNYSRTEEYRRRARETSLAKWGVDSFTKTEEYVRKAKESYLRRWGVDSYLKTEEGRSRMRRAILERHGKDSVLKEETFRARNFAIASDPSYVAYVGGGVSSFRCDLGMGHTFSIDTDNYFGRKRSGNALCTVCNPISSSASIKEAALRDYIASIYQGEIVPSHRDGMELDIYLPGMAIGFEMNGLYWHSDRCREKGYHLRKTEHFRDRGVRVFHVWEDDWAHRQDVVKSQVRHVLGLAETRVHARRCSVREVGTKLCRGFLDANHVQGHAASSVKLGLFDGERLVSVMTFDRYEGRKKMGEGEYNLNRFCCLMGHSVPGAASKLLARFVSEMRPTRIISYADRDWSAGGLYERLGFRLVGATPPDYKYVVGGRRLHKSRFRKSRLGYTVTEGAYSDEAGIPKVWDCGKLKYEMSLPESDQAPPVPAVGQHEGT